MTSGPANRQAIRIAAFCAASAVQLLIVWAFVVALQMRGSESTQGASQLTQAVLLYEASEDFSALRAPMHRPRSVLAPTATLPPLVTPSVNFPADKSQASVDWAAAAQVASRGFVVAQEIASRQRNATGEQPLRGPNAVDGSSPPEFPWSRQPLTSWLDFDPTTLVTSIKLGKHCGFGLFIILPVFGCVLDHMDPDPGRGDLFDAKFAARPLRLPDPAIPTPVEPWRAPAMDGVVVQQPTP